MRQDPPPGEAAWLASNQRRLMQGVRQVAARLARHAGVEPSRRPAAPRSSRFRTGRAAASPPLADDAASTLDVLTTTFGLSGFERDVLLLCAGMELDGRFPALCAAAHGDPQRPYPTFGLALAVLPGAHWSAVTPGAPLRRWRLLELGGGLPPSPTQAPLRIDERVLHHLAGIDEMDGRLADLLEPGRPPAEPDPWSAAQAARVAAAWADAADQNPVVQLWGGRIDEQRTVAAAVCARLGLGFRVVAADALPLDARELATFTDLWSREAVLGRLCLVVDCTSLDPGDHARAAAVARLLEGAAYPVMSVGREPRPGGLRPALGFEVEPPSAPEQRAVWLRELGDASWALNGQVDVLVEQFPLAAPRIRAARAEAVGGLAGRTTPVTPGDLATALWDACRRQARLPVEGLAQRVESAAGWADLVLPAGQMAALREMVLQVRNRYVVYEEWGFAARAGRGLGVTALFAGPTGAGKTLAAEVIANELRLDLFRIDLSQVVSKYIGETERNLRRVFDAAQQAGACLLFDEADALFGKRSEVKDSHDRYANIEVGYLLQRMEAYRGLAILTTNQKEALDSAFLRRIRFVVDFPFPDVGLRAEIWRRIFPETTPRSRLDVDLLARLDVAGGNIRNIALQAAFLAAEEREVVRMRHLARAARGECAKIGKPVGLLEGWQ